MVYFNTDEALLDDKDRPRDQYWFKILPWRQMDKFKLRNANKSLVDYFSICWWKEVTGVTTANMKSSTAVKIPLLTDNKWQFTTTETYPYTKDQLEGMCKTEKIWDSSWLNKDWIVYVPDAWIYFIQYIVEFHWINGTTMPTSASQSPKLMTQLDYYKNWKYAWQVEIDYWWWLVQPDRIVWTDLDYFDKWDAVWISALHSRNWTKAFCRWILKIQKLS